MKRMLEKTILFLFIAVVVAYIATIFQWVYRLFRPKKKET